MDNISNIFIEKISSYNIFNYLFPGVVFCNLVDLMTRFDFKIDNFLVELFMYYFVGMIISRIGSLFVEKALKKIEFDGKKFLIFADYKDYIDACKDDSKIEILSEVNNTYRTIVAAFISFGAVLIYDKFIYDNLEKNCSCANEIIAVLVGIFVFIVFIISYKKQTDYIRKRVEKYLQKENDNK